MSSKVEYWDLKSPQQGGMDVQLTKGKTDEVSITFRTKQGEEIVVHCPLVDFKDKVTKLDWDALPQAT